MFLGREIPDRPEEIALVEALRARHDELAALFDTYSGHWDFEDPVYRFYHQSWKVYYLQGQTSQIVRVLESLAPDRPLNAWFTQIVAEGTGKTFAMQDNENWLPTTRPILEAFFHARYFLDMAVRYGTFESPPLPLP
jgi:hypothetical protein